MMGQHNQANWRGWHGHGSCYILLKGWSSVFHNRSLNLVLCYSSVSFSLARFLPLLLLPPSLSGVDELKLLKKWNVHIYHVYDVPRCAIAEVNGVRLQLLELEVPLGMSLSGFWERW